MPKKKPRKLNLIKKDLWKLAARSIKERDNYTCWLCGKRDNGSAIHCSHILPKGLYPRYEFEEWNLKSLCMHCHLAFWHKDPIHAAMKFKQMYPKKYAEAVQKAIDYPLKKAYTRKELLQKIEHYKGPITW